MLILISITALSLLFALCVPLVLLLRSGSISKLIARYKAGGISSVIYTFIWMMTVAGIAMSLASATEHAGLW